jgi:uncharacterized protein (TIGR00725 family)
MPRLPIVGVMGSGAEPHAERAAEVGRWLAAIGVHLLTGGGGGVMAAVARAFHETPERRGLVIGILPAEAFGSATPKRGYPNPWVEIPIFTHLPSGDDPRSRNHLNVLSADVVIFLPGGAGTAHEAALAVAYGKPAIAYLASRGEIPGLPAAIPVLTSFDELRGFVSRQLGHAAPA